MLQAIKKSAVIR